MSPWLNVVRSLRDGVGRIALYLSAKAEFGDSLQMTLQRRLSVRRRCSRDLQARGHSRGDKKDGGSCEDPPCKGISA